ncbi:hypothetical protein CMI47_10720 [Candidatus Pacearchaeota archaeon]|nr:hypothetical protein [Candidatus Pacearchaeota archaeon]|tara:strand:+ start:754 stop:1953 length:1200 start_codon:yes stop_codon:yes gene_type:complete
MASDESGPLPGPFTLPLQAVDWALKIPSSYNALRTDTVMKKAKVMTQPEPLSPLDGWVAGGTATSNQPSGEYICQVMLIDVLLGHVKFYGDVCELALSSNSEQYSKFMSLYTRMTIPKVGDSLMPHINDIVEVSLDPGDNGTPLDYQNGTFVKIFSRPAPVVDIEATCVSLRSMFGNGNDAPLGGEDPGNCPWSNGGQQYTATWNSSEYPGTGDTWNGTILKNGQIEDTGLLETDSKSGAQLLIPAMVDFKKLAAAYETKFPGKTLKGSGYRTYASQIALRNKRHLNGAFVCGQGEHDASGKFVGMAATPGTSNHGWAAAFDVDRSASGWTNGNEGDSPEFQWINKFSKNFNFVFGVRNEHWHLDWMPFSRQVDGKIASTSQSSWVSSAGTEYTNITLA